MPNLYATSYKVKLALGDAYPLNSVKYEAQLYRLIDAISREFDTITARSFYPFSGDKYYSGKGNSKLWIDDLLSLTALYYSLDEGSNYTAFSSNDYLLSRAGNINTQEAYNFIIGNTSVSANQNWFPPGQRSVKASGVWAYHEYRDMAWEEVDSLTADLSSSASELEVGDADGDDLFGFEPRFQVGYILKIGDEFLELLRIDAGADTLTVRRGINGTSAASHSTDDPVYVWKVTPLVQDSVIIQATRQLQRGLQGYADSRADESLGGRIFWTKKLDPEVVAKISGLIKP